MNGNNSIPSVPLYNKKSIMIPLLIFITVIAIGSIILYLNSKIYLSTDDAFIDGNKVTVSSKYIGRIIKINTEEGNIVKKGQLLIEMDDSDLRAQENQSKATVLYAEQSYKLANINLTKAQEDFKRAKLQFKNNVISKELFEHAQKTLEAAEAQSNIAQAQINTSKAQLGVIETQLGNINIYAPMDGVVAKKWSMQGDVVQPGQPILSLYDLKNLWITANFEETKYARIKLNSKVMINVDAYKGQDFEGRISELGVYTASQFSLIPPNNAAGNFTKVTQRIPIKISIEGINSRALTDKYPLLPGMSVEIKIRIKK